MTVNRQQALLGRRTRHDGGSTYINALAFNTLLSSQETRAHRQQDNDRRRGNLATVLRVLPDVNSVPRNFADPWDFPYHQDTNAPRSHGTRVAPDNGSLVAPRVASRLPAFRPSPGNKNPRGTQDPRQIKVRKSHVPP